MRENINVYAFCLYVLWLIYKYKLYYLDFITSIAEDDVSLLAWKQANLAIIFATKDPAVVHRKKAVFLIERLLML